MNTDPQSPAFQDIQPTRDIPPAELAAGAWTGLSDEEARILADTPTSNRMAKLRELRGELSHNQRKQALKRRGLR
jgi:hypothetical protein